MQTTTTLDRDIAVRRLKTIGDETRMAILLQLAGGEQCVCDILDGVDASQSLTSFHLRALREVGLVTDRRVGRWVHYAINPSAVAELEEFLQVIRRAAVSAPRCSNDCCG